MDKDQLKAKALECSKYFAKLSGIGTALSVASVTLAYLETQWVDVPRDNGFFNTLVVLERMVDTRGMVITRYIERLQEYEAAVLEAIGETFNDDSLAHVLESESRGHSEFADFNKMLQDALEHL
jgi:hypothetical protein